MKKLSNLKLICLLGILVVALVLVATNLIHAKGKPIKWTAVILESSSNLWGIGDPEGGGWTYKAGVDGVDIHSGTSTCSSRNDKTYSSYIMFDIRLPSQIQFVLGGDTIGVNQEEQENVTCGFPLPTGSIWPSCLFDFLNFPQPFDDPVPNMPDYQLVHFIFSTQNCPDREDFNFLDMPIGDSKTMKLRFSIVGQNTSGDCDDCNEFNYHNVSGVAHGYSNQPDIFIYRESENEWVVSVNTLFDNPDYQGPSPYYNLVDHIFETYCKCTPISSKGKSKRMQKEYKYSGWMKTLLHFEIKFIKS